MAELAKELRAHGREVAQALCAGVLRHRRIAGLEVHVPDPWCVVGKHLHWIGAGVSEMARIETEPEAGRVRTPHQLADLRGGLDVAATVRVEDGSQPGLLLHCASG